MSTPLAKNLFHGVSRCTELVIDKGKGSFIYSGERKILDFTAGFAVTNLGHCHPKVVQAVQKQAGELMHGQSSMFHSKPLLELADRLVGIDGILPKTFDRVNFWNSGAEAVEAAMKLSKHATKRQNFIVFQNAFHGRTFGCMGLTSSKTTLKIGLSPFLPGIHLAPFGYQNENAIQQLELMFKQQIPADEVAAIIIEPVQGEGGYVPAPNAFLKGLRKICDKYGIMLVFDEIQSGMGRTSTGEGVYFAMQHHDVIPDILIAAKGIANGMPLSLIASRTEITSKQHAGAMGGTYSGNPLSCAAGVAVIDAFKEENILQNVVQRADQLSTYLNSLNKSKYAISDIRGLGIMIGVEFDHRIVPTGTAQKICNEALNRDLFMMTASCKEVIRFMPPLNVSEIEMNMAIDRFQSALDSVFVSQSQSQSLTPYNYDQSKYQIQPYSADIIDNDNDNNGKIIKRKKIFA